MPRTPLGTMASKYGHGSGDISSFYGAAQRVSCPNRPFGRWADVGQRKNGRSGEKNLSAARCAWAVLGGIPSGWGQFGAVVKKWAVVIAGGLIDIAHLADFRFGYLASTFSVRPPQNPKDLGFRVFSPFALRWCRPFGLKTPASCRTENHDLPAFWPRKIRLTDF